MIVNLSEVKKQLGFKTPYTLRKAVKDGLLDDYLRRGADKRCVYLELTPPGMPSLRERIQHHTAFHRYEIETKGHLRTGPSELLHSSTTSLEGGHRGLHRSGGN